MVCDHMLLMYLFGNALEQEAEVETEVETEVEAQPEEEEPDV